MGGAVSPTWSTPEVPVLLLLILVAFPFLALAPVAIARAVSA